MKKEDASIRKRGQIGIYIILAIVIVAGIVVFFLFRGSLFAESIPSEFRPIYNLYEECISEEARIGASLLGSQGGRIDTGAYIPGNDFIPYGSHLNFLSTSVPYWYSVSANGFVIEQAPSKSEMERELNEFIAGRLNENCDFQRFYEQGFYIEYGEPEVSTSIESERINVQVTSSLSSVRGESSARKNEHEVSVNSKLGAFYDSARNIYEAQLADGFLEDYAVDVLRLYAPVDGVEIQCGPVTWETAEVVRELHEALENNFGNIRFEGSYYTLSEREDEYFVVDVPVRNSARVIYSSEWPSKVEVTPANEVVMIAEPIGNQQGLGVMGFCYVPYHFVWDVGFPVMIQVYDGTELFQFPVLVQIDNNVAKEAELISALGNEEPEFNVCDFREGNVRVNTFDNRLNPIEADIEYACLGEVCSLGTSEANGNSASLTTDIPQCLNGYLIAKAEGYADEKKIFSSNSESVVDLILEREYSIEVEVRVNGRLLREGETALVHVISPDMEVASAVIPQATILELKEGEYEIFAYVYGNSAITIPASKQTQCQRVPRSGIAGIFGVTREECYDIEIPETKVEQALIGGGRTNTYILESQLERGKMAINVEEFPRVSSLEQLQYNYALFETSNVGVSYT